MSGVLLAALMAGEVEDRVDAGLTAIKAGDFDAARDELDAAEEALPSSEEIVLGHTMASIHYYRGVIAYHDGNEDDTLGHWRKALVVDSSYGFDRTLIADGDPADLFEALRSEVGQRPQVASGVTEEGPRVYIDGRLVYDYDHIVQGQHLVQVLCGDALVSVLVEVPPTPVYASVCPGYVAPASVVEAAPVSLPEPELGAPRSLRGPALMGGGGVLILAGAAVNFAVVGPTWREIQQARAFPFLHDRASADVLTTRFNRGRYATMGLYGLGALSLSAGAVWTVRF